MLSSIIDNFISQILVFNWLQMQMEGVIILETTCFQNPGWLGGSFAFHFRTKPDKEGVLLNIPFEVPTAN